MVISIDDFLVFCDRTLEGTRRTIAGLDDDLVNRAPDHAEANTPFGLVTHALGALDWWTTHMVLGRPTDRTRSLEFGATGSIADLDAAITSAEARLHQLAPELAAATELAHQPRTIVPLRGLWTVGAALLHAYEEVAQHLGHLEVTADWLRAGSGAIDRSRAGESSTT